MTEPFRPAKCPVCGWGNGLHQSDCPHKTPDHDHTPPQWQRGLLTAYIDLRRDCVAIEELISNPNSSLSEDDLKRLDKAVTVMKVSFKMVKKVLRSHNVKDLKVWREVEIKL